MNERGGRQPHESPHPRLRVVVGAAAPRRRDERLINSRILGGTKGAVKKIGERSGSSYTKRRRHDALTAPDVRKPETTLMCLRLCLAALSVALLGVPARASGFLRYVP